jgi:calcineurin-like phosphoesterase family protein
MIDQIGLNKSDQLYFLGDYIDKGKDGAGVIDFILSLKEEGFQVFPLKGNHEHNLIHAYETYEESMFLGFVRRLKSTSNFVAICLTTTNWISFGWYTPASIHEQMIYLRINRPCLNKGLLSIKHIY